MSFTPFPDFRAGDRLFAAQMDQITGAINALELANTAAAIRNAVPSITALRAIAYDAARVTGTPQLVAGYYAANDGGGGPFYWDATSTAIDNSASVIKPNALSISDPGRWIAQFPLNIIPAARCGAVGDYNGSIGTDDTAALQRMITIAAGRRCMLDAKAYRITAPLTASNSVNIQGVGMGAGPGNSSLDINSGPASRIYCDFADPIAFSLTGTQPFTFRDFQINVTPTFRNPSGGAGIYVQPGAGSATNANTKIENVCFAYLYRGISVNKASWWTITGCYFGEWSLDAIYSESDGSAEASLGWVTGNYFFGRNNATQRCCIYLANGYTVIAFNEILGGQFGIFVNPYAYDSGFIQIGPKNTIEEQYYGGVKLTATGTTNVAMVGITDNEFSSDSTSATYLYSILLDDTPARAYLTSVDIARNIMRNRGSVSSGYIRVAGGQSVTVSENKGEQIAGTGAVFISVNGQVNTSCFGAPIQVLNNQTFGTFTTRYAFNATVPSLLEDRVAMTFAAIPSFCQDGSDIYVSDGRSTSTTDFTVRNGGVGCRAFRERGGWYTAGYRV